MVILDLLSIELLCGDTDDIWAVRYKGSTFQRHTRLQKWHKIYFYLSKEHRHFYDSPKKGQRCFRKKINHLKYFSMPVSWIPIMQKRVLRGFCHEMLLDLFTTPGKITVCATNLCHLSLNTRSLRCRNYATYPCWDRGDWPVQSLIESTTRTD